MLVKFDLAVMVCCDIVKGFSQVMLFKHVVNPGCLNEFLHSLDSSLSLPIALWVKRAEKRHCVGIPTLWQNLEKVLM